MIFDYTVKHNGVRYPAGTDVPVGGDAPHVFELGSVVHAEHRLGVSNIDGE